MRYLFQTHRTQILALLFLPIAFQACRSKSIQIQPGAYVTVDGTDDGLNTIQRSFDEVKVIEGGVMVTLGSDLIFPINSSYLNDLAKRELDKLVDAVKGERDRQLIIEGHTDITGTAEYNQWLSEKRAESVKNYLVSQGMSASQIKTSGLGITKPVASNNTQEGRIKNRRVEITIVN